MRIVQLSDTHVRCGGKVTTANAERIVEFINLVLRPDLVVHSGDVVGLDPDDEADRSAAVAVLAELKAPLLVVPGNHDVGSGGSTPWMGLGVTSARVAAHNRVLGPAPFLERAGEWSILGLNSEIIDSGLPEEQAQWEWLENVLAGPAGPPLILFMHRPIWNHRPTLPADENSISARSRERLLALPGAARIRATGHGHLHWYRSWQRPELLEVWCSSSSLLGPVYEETPVFRECGVVEWRLDDDVLTTRFRAPVDLDQREITAVPELEAGLRALRARSAQDRS
jgi:3',5'-cyclic AMP phosphodiesterase CpdA